MSMLVVLALEIKAADKPTPIPIAQSDQQEYRATIQQMTQLANILEKIRYHACLVAKVSEQECGPIQMNGTVLRMEKVTGSTPSLSTPSTGDPPKPIPAPATPKP